MCPELRCGRKWGEQKKLGRLRDRAVISLLLGHSPDLTRSAPRPHTLGVSSTMQHLVQLQADISAATQGRCQDAAQIEPPIHDWQTSRSVGLIAMVF